MNAEQPATSEQPMPVQSRRAAEHHEADIAMTPQIWVASLADYKHGTVHGVCLNATQDEATLQAAIDTMLAASPQATASGEPSDEWAIHDYRGFGPLHIDAHESLDWISKVAQGIAEHGLAFAAWADVVEELELLDGFDAAYLGHYDDLHTYIEQLVNDLGYNRILDEALPASIRPYVKLDISATANDLQLGGDLQALTATNGGVWIFNAR